MIVVMPIIAGYPMPCRRQLVKPSARTSGKKLAEQTSVLKCLGLKFERPGWEAKPAFGVFLAKSS